MQLKRPVPDSTRCVLLYYTFILRILEWLLCSLLWLTALMKVWFYNWNPPLPIHHWECKLAPTLILRQLTSPSWTLCPTVAHVYFDIINNGFKDVVTCHILLLLLCISCKSTLKHAQWLWYAECVKRKYINQCVFRSTVNAMSKDPGWHNKKCLVSNSKN